jgi:hypothetical protein
MDFIDFLRYLLTFFELAACIVGFLYWNKIKKSNWKLFPIYLTIIITIELFGYYSIRNHGLSGYNNNVYQYFSIPLQFLFFCWLFYKYFFKLWQKIAALIGVMVFLVFWMIEILSEQKTTHWFISLSYDSGTIILLVLILLFIVQLISADEILNFKTNIMFWVAMGLFAGYICTIPYYIWRNYLIVYEKTRPDLLYTAFYGFMFLNYLMYSLFCVGFIKWKQTN